MLCAGIRNGSRNTIQNAIAIVWLPVALPHSSFHSSDLISFHAVCAGVLTGSGHVEYGRDPVHLVVRLLPL